MNGKRIVCLVMAAALLAGCSSAGQTPAAPSADTAAIAAEATAAATDEPAQTDEALTVQVERIDGKIVTARIGTLTQPEPPDRSENGQPSGEAGTKPPDMPEGGAPAANGSQPPEKTNGDAPASGGQPPEKPDGGAPGGMNGFTAGEESVVFTVTDATVITKKSREDENSAGFDDIAVGSLLTVTVDGAQQALVIIITENMPGSADGPGGPGSGTGAVSNGSAAATLDGDAEIRDTAYASTGDDENALRIDGANVTLESVTLSKLAGASSNTENGDFYGANAALLALGGATATLKNLTVSTDVKNGNGVFCYGEGTTVNIADSVIRTAGDNSGGIQTTGGGTMNAANLDIATEGNSAAAIRSDRGGGTVTVDGGSYVTKGAGSPAIYSTAAISVSNALLSAAASEAVVVEGKNSVSLTDCVASGNMTGTYADDADENLHAVMIYQSMSGDAEVGQAAFSMTDGSLTALAGDLLYVTNTRCTIALRSVSLALSNGVLLRVAGNAGTRGWGKAGANGGQVVMTAAAQTLTGNLLVDSLSSLALTLDEGSVLEGAVNPDGAAGTVDVTLAGGSTWQLTADSYITSFTGDMANVDAGGFTLYVGGVAQ